jgi:hypothetical protein
VHHTIEMVVPAKATEGVLAELNALEGVVALCVVYGCRSSRQATWSPCMC